MNKKGKSIHLQKGCRCLFGALGFALILLGEVNQVASDDGCAPHSVPYDKVGDVVYCKCVSGYVQIQDVCVKEECARSQKRLKDVKSGLEKIEREISQLHNRISGARKDLKTLDNLNSNYARNVEEWSGLATDAREEARERAFHAILDLSWGKLTSAGRLSTAKATRKASNDYRKARALVERYKTHTPGSQKLFQKALADKNKAFAKEGGMVLNRTIIDGGDKLYKLWRTTSASVALVNAPDQVEVWESFIRLSGSLSSAIASDWQAIRAARTIKGLPLSPHAVKLFRGISLAATNIELLPAVMYGWGGALFARPRLKQLLELQEQNFKLVAERTKNYKELLEDRKDLLRKKRVKDHIRLNMVMAINTQCN